MEKIDPLYPKNANIYAKNRPFFSKSQICELHKKDPFSAKIRTMMRTLSQREWRDRAVLIS